MEVAKSERLGGSVSRNKLRCGLASVWSRIGNSSWLQDDSCAIGEQKILSWQSGAGD
jgi:hypothetical protein